MEVYILHTDAEVFGHMQDFIILLFIEIKFSCIPNVLGSGGVAGEG